MKIIYIKYSSILLFCFLIEWWLFYYAPFNFPQRVNVAFLTEPGEAIPSINISGMLIIISILTALVFALKAVLKTNSETTIFKLVGFGTLLVLIPQVIFQFIRITFLNLPSFSEKFHYFIIGVFGVTAYGVIISFLIAWQLKTRNTGKLLLMILILIIFFNLSKYLTF